MAVPIMCLDVARFVINVTGYDCRRYSGRKVSASMNCVTVRRKRKM